MPLDDSLYPYAGLSRIVIETEDFYEIRDNETYIPAFLQIYGERSAMSDVITVSLKGRGNSSFTSAKYGYKLEFPEKQGMFEMPPSKDWVLLPNFLDKSYLRNAVTFKVSKALGEDWVPRYRFVELYVNREYKGVYQFAEKVKVDKQRVDVSSNAVLIEVDHKYKSGERVIFSKSGVPFRVHHPKDASDSLLNYVRAYLNEVEKLLEGNFELDSFAEKVDLDAYIRYYWIQEFSKNPDGNFKTSVFFTLEPSGKIVMGPVWDFDVAYGCAYVRKYDGWSIRNSYWNKRLFSNADFVDKVNAWWKNNGDKIKNIMHESLNESESLIVPMENNYRRWPILQEGEMLGTKLEIYDNYMEAVEDLRNWIENRWLWIEGAVP